MENNNFFNDRMLQIGATNENSKITLLNPMADVGSQLMKDCSIFKEDKTGNIEISFWNIEGEIINYEKKGDGKMSHINARFINWTQTRLKEPIGDMKYRMPAGAGIYPFFTPLLTQAYKEGTQIETLFITEGVFKAFKASTYNVYCIGLTSITHYRDSETKKIHYDIIKIIKKCKVKNVVILWDGDCLDISEKQLHDRFDIAKRPLGFFNSAKNIRWELKNELSDHEDSFDIYFMHVKSDSYLSKPKGLDDLLCAAEKEKEEIEVVRDMHRLQEKMNRYFYKVKITSTVALLSEYFCLNRNNPEQLYNRFSHIILHHEFIYYGSLWKYDDQASELREIAPGWAKNIKWIGDDFFKLVDEPSAHGPIEKKLIKRSKQSLCDELEQKSFYKKLDHYEGFCNVPDHINYKPDYENFYNRYFAFIHSPGSGRFETTIEFFKHIFGEEKIEYRGKEMLEYELGLDYFQLLYENPTQILPVLILFSEENNTGKSTWGKYLRFVFGHNTIQVGNSDFKTEFNEHFADKLLAVCEETLLDRKKDVELIKALSTSTRITVNPKGSKRYEIDFFCKFQFYSNNKRMIYINKHDERFWILQIPVPKNDDPNILQKLMAEFPAFLNYIQSRKLKTEKESRMWFHPSLIRTSAFDDTVKINEPAQARQLRERIKQDFLDFGEAEIMMPLKDINRTYFANKVDISWLKEILKDYLEVDVMKTEDGKSKQVRGYFYRWEDYVDSDGNYEQRKYKSIFNGRPYKFCRSEFISIEEEIDFEDVNAFEDTLEG